MTSIDVSRITFEPATVTFLEMHDPQEYPVPIPDTHFALLPKPVSVIDYRKFYYGVGEKYSWLDRMVMADEELFEKINAANVDIYVFNVEGKPAGYIEFIKEERFVEIQYFGLMQTFIGKGLGKYFLQWAIAKSWSYKPEWIQLNTCTLDHPNALPNYKRSGFTEVRTEIQQRRVMR